MYAYLTWVAMWDRFFRQQAYIGITRSRMRWYVRKRNLTHRVGILPGTRQASFLVEILTPWVISILHLWWIVIIPYTSYQPVGKMKKVRKGAKIRNRYNQVPHLTQDTNGKVTNSQQTPQTRAKSSALSQQVTTKHI